MAYEIAKVRDLVKKISILAALGLALAAGTIFAFHGRSEGDGKQGLAVVSYSVGTLRGEKPKLEAVVAGIQKQGIRMRFCYRRCRMRVLRWALPARSPSLSCFQGVPGEWGWVLDGHSCNPTSFKPDVA